MTIKKTNDDPVEFELEGNVRFSLAGYDTVENWVVQESDTEVRALLVNIIEQLKKD